MHLFTKNCSSAKFVQDGYPSTWLASWNKIISQSADITYKDYVKKKMHSWDVQWHVMKCGCTMIRPKANAEACNGNTRTHLLPRNSSLRCQQGSFCWQFSGIPKGLFWNISTNEDRWWLVPDIAKYCIKHWSQQYSPNIAGDWHKVSFSCMKMSVHIQLPTHMAHLHNWVWGPSLSSLQLRPCTVRLSSFRACENCIEKVPICQW